MKKILFVNDEMVMGGVARILNTLLSNLDSSKYQIDLLLLHNHGELKSEIPSHVNIIDSSNFFDTVDLRLREIRNFKQLVKKVRLLVYMKTGLIKYRIKRERKKMLSNQYDVEFSAKEGFCTVFTAFGDSKRKLNWVQTDYKVQNFSKNHMPLIKRALRDIDVNIACSNVARDSYKEVFNIENVITIHNLMNTSVIDVKQDEEVIDYDFNDDVVNYITVARFHPQKALHRIINACKMAVDQGLNHKLCIIGGGELEQELRDQVKELGLGDVVTFLGYKTNPYSYIKKADLFLMSSKYEGFPTIVLESLMCSTPVLTTSVAGVDEQLVKEHYGWIVENDSDSFNQAYMNKMNKKELKEMKNKLQSYQYYNEKILNDLEALF